MGNMRNVYQLLVGKPEGKKPLGRPLHTRKDNIKMDSSESVGGLEWIHLAQDENH
jgi:hypothetical protein